MTFYSSPEQNTPFGGFFWKRTLLKIVYHVIFHCNARETVAHNCFIIFWILRRIVLLEKEHIDHSVDDCVDSSDFPEGSNMLHLGVTWFFCSLIWIKTTAHYPRNLLYDDHGDAISFTTVLNDSTQLQKLLTLVNKFSPIMFFRKHYWKHHF